MLERVTLVTTTGTGPERTATAAAATAAATAAARCPLCGAAGWPARQTA